MPTIVGSNRDEGRLFALTTRSRGSYETRIRAEYGSSAEAVLARYAPTSYGGSALQAYAAVMTDSRFACPAEELRQSLSKTSTVFGYEFADADAPSTLPRLLTGGSMGAYHAAELAFVFGSSWALTDVRDFTRDQHKLSQRMMDAWGKFVRDGRPGADWPPFERDKPSVKIWQASRNENDASVGKGARDGETSDFYQRHECAFWSALSSP